MRLVWELVGFSEEGDEKYTTEIVLMEHEQRTRDLLARAIVGLGVAYDPEGFPAHIILLGSYSNKSVHEMITQNKVPAQSPPPNLPTEHRSIETIPTGEYL